MDESWLARVMWLVPINEQSPSYGPKNSIGMKAAFVGALSYRPAPAGPR